MKKYLSLLAIALVAIFTLSLPSCSKGDEAGSGGDLVGTWQITGVLGGFGEAFGGKGYTQFRGNGVFYDVSIDKGLLSPRNQPKVEVSRGTYTRSGNEIIVKGEGEKEFRAQIISLSKDKLVLKYDEPISITWEMSRVPDSEVEVYLKGR